MLNGRRGDAVALAMRIVVKVATITQADRLIPVSCAHIDSCLYSGQAGLDLAEHLVRLGARVAVSTTLNVGSLDLLHPELFRGDDETRRAGGRLMDAYVSMGCRATWTCAPYLLTRRPRFGEQIAWAESNAIVFANSVLGARTERYGDFIDVAAAVTGRVPYTGLHVESNRRGEMIFDVSGLRTDLRSAPSFFPVLGHLIGADTGDRIPVILGLPTSTSEDDLRALGAAAASSGGVALFHAVGITPEAPTLQAAIGEGANVPRVDVMIERLVAARKDLSTAPDGRIDAVSIGTPHLSVEGFRRLMPLLDSFPIHPDVMFYVSTSRHVLDKIRRLDWLRRCEEAGITLIVDTCTYATSMLEPDTEVVMTDSAKWAYYAPGTTGVEVVFGSLEDCVQSAAAGHVVRDDSVWQ